MNNKDILAIVILITLSTIFAMDVSPVFIQDDGLLDGVAKTQTNPLALTSPEEFEAIVGDAQKKSQCLIFFVEDYFSFEDISSKDEKGSPFFHLKQAFMDKRVKLLPRVLEPYNYLKNRFQPFDFNTFHVQRTTTKLRLEEEYKFLYIFFEDGTNETRTQKLRRHDAIIQEVTFAVRQMSKGPVVAFYTGKHNPVEEELDLRKNTPKIVRPLPTVPGKTIAALCGTASFEFVDAIMRHAHDKPSFLKVISCNSEFHGKDGWSYNITIEDLGQTDNSLMSPYYELIFYFNFLDRRLPSKGWRLNRVSYGSQSRKAKTTKWFEVSGGWNEFYENPRPLEMQLEPDISSIPKLEMNPRPLEIQLEPDISSIPKLEMKTFRIYLGSLKALMPPPPAPKRTTKKSSVPSTTKTQVTRTFYFRNQEDQNESTRSRYSEELANLTQLYYADDIKFRADKSVIVKQSADRYVDIVLFDCLIIVSIQIFVLLFAVQMLMNIRTNSRYDSSDQPPLFTGDIGE